MNDNVKPLPGVTINGPMRDGIEHLKRNQADLIEYNAISALIMRKKYLALVEQGFTPEQALQLCKVQ